MPRGRARPNPLPLYARAVPDRPAPPLVTITDPSQPAPLSDVIGEDRPDRFSRSQKRWAWALAALVALGAGAAWGLQQLAEQHRLEQAAVRELSLSLLGNDRVGTGSADVTVLNAGPHAVTVLSVGLDLPHLPALTTRPTKVGATEPSAIPVTLPTTCPASVAGSPRNLLLRVRTFLGNETTLRVNVSNGKGFVSQVVYAALAPCGPPPASSITTRVVVHRTAENVDLGLTVTNSSALPRQISEPAFTGDDTGGGIISAGAPDLHLLDLPPHGTAFFGASLFLDDCELAKQSWTATARGGVQAEVTGRGGETVVVVPFADEGMRRFVLAACASPLPSDQGGFGGVITTPLPGNAPVG